MIKEYLIINFAKNIPYIALQNKWITCEFLFLRSNIKDQLNFVARF